MAIKEGLKTSLNQIREISTEIYTRTVPEITPDTNSAVYGEAIMSDPGIMNEFVGQLINRIVYTQTMSKIYNNPLKFLEGDTIPLGYAGQEIYVNPAKGRKFNGDDFAGLLVKYEADVKVQYTKVNSDIQYPVTVSRQGLKKAFVSWDSLEQFISALTNSLYNGAYIDEYYLTKNIIGNAYKENSCITEVITGITTEALAKEFITKARELFLNFQSPSSNYNAWKLMGGEGRAITTFTMPEDIVFILKNSVASYIDVNVLASAFNIEKSSLLGKIVYVDNFDQYDENGTKIFDGSDIVGIMADKAWFRIKTQDMFMDDFKNANNRTWQYYLNVIKMYMHSLFANGVVFTTKEVVVPIESMKFEMDSVTIPKTATMMIDNNILPTGANSPDVTYTSADSTKVKVVKSLENAVIIEGVATGSAKITATAGTGETAITSEITVTVK